MVSSNLNAPDSLFLVNEFPVKISFYVYAGLILKKDTSYRLGFDVFFEGTSIVDSDQSKADTEALHSTGTKQDDYISISSTYISGVTFNNEGIHEIRVSIFMGDVGEGEVREDAIDEQSCYVLVRKNEGKN